MNRVLGNSGIDAVRINELPQGALRDAASLQCDLEAEQTIWLQAIEYAASFPYFAGVFTPHEVSLHLSDVMGPIV
jgi:hypothetical protein